MNKTKLEKKETPHSPISFASKPQFVSEEPQKKSEAQKNSEQTSMTSFASYSGPIPPPNFLLEYEKMVPGIAKRFLEEPHVESEHRRALQKMMAQEQVKLANRGQKMAFLLAGSCTLGAFGAIFLGYSLEGLGALVASITTFAYIFCYVKRRQ
jgi:uncharacterized membrane protein